MHEDPPDHCCSDGYTADHQIKKAEIDRTPRRIAAVIRFHTVWKDFAGKTAVVTGGGSGMGRELVRQLVAEGCNVAMCDVSTRSMDETKRLCEIEGVPQGLRITTRVADVSDEVQVQQFRDEVAER